MISTNLTISCVEKPCETMCMQKSLCSSRISSVLINFGSERQEDSWQGAVKCSEDGFSKGPFFPLCNSFIVPRMLPGQTLIFLLRMFISVKTSFYIAENFTLRDGQKIWQTPQIIVFVGKKVHEKLRQDCIAPWRCDLFPLGPNILFFYFLYILLFSIYSYLTLTVMRCHNCTQTRFMR